MIESIESRRSIRKYLARPVDDETIRALIESARLAPSGSNTQPWHFIVVKDETTRRRIARVSHDQQWMLTAPVLIVCVADVLARTKVDAGPAIDENSPQLDVKQIIRDTAIAVEHLVLEAADRGLGTCWVAWFVQNEIRPVLGVPPDKFVLAVITIGYPDEAPRPRPRKRFDEIVHFEKW